MTSNQEIIAKVNEAYDYLTDTFEHVQIIVQTAECKYLFAHTPNMVACLGQLELAKAKILCDLRDNDDRREPAVW